MSKRKCPVTRKRSFHDEAEAKRGLTAVRQTAPPGDLNVPVRYYRCEHCHRWHLTSQPVDESRRRLPTDAPVAPPPPPPRTLEDEVAALERIIRRCIADNCGTCMHDPEWGAYLIRRQPILPNNQPTNQGEASP